MAFKVPTQQPLTMSQNEALAKLNSMNNLLTIPFKQFFDKPKSKQISLLDFMTMIANSILGTGYIDTLILKFISDLFDKNSTKLEKAIIKALAGALDAKPITIKQGVSNQDWLTANVEPELHAAMQVLKAVLVKRIMILIYGPKERMKPMEIPKGNTYNNPYLPDSGLYDDLTPEQYLDNASLSDVMFTTVNTESNSFGDVEMNIVKLKQQLERGQVTFTVSCQDVKINLPEFILESADNAIDNNVAVFLGTTVQGAQAQYQNPAKVLVELTGHVDNEVQRINSEENVSAVRKSWLRILLDKIINLLPLVLYPVLRKVLGKVNAQIASETGIDPNLTVENTLGLAVALKNGFSDKNLFEKNSTFYRIMMNAVYSIILAIILKKLIPKITKLITKALAKRRANDLKRKIKRYQARAKLLQEQAKNVEKKVMAAKALTVIKPIMNYVG